MKKVIALVLVAAAIFGYYKMSKKDQDQVLDTGRNVAQVTGKVFSSAYNALMDQTKTLNTDSSKSDLEKAQKDLESEKKKTTDKSALEKIQDQIDRIKAAINVQDLKKQLDDKLADAAKAKENASKTMDQIREDLKKADEGYKSLTQKLDDAKKAYDEAAAKVSSK